MLTFMVVPFAGDHYFILPEDEFTQVMDNMKKIRLGVAHLEAKGRQRDTNMARMEEKLGE